MPLTVCGIAPVLGYAYAFAVPGQGPDLGGGRMVTRGGVLAATAAGVAMGAAAASPASALLRPEGGRSTTAVPRVADPATPDPTAPAHGGIPRTIAARKGVAGGRLRVPRTDFPLSHLGITLSGQARLRVRSADGWGRWTTVGSCGGSRDGREALTSTVVATPQADGYDLVVDGDARVVELNTVDGPVLATPAAAATNMPLPGLYVSVPYLSRAAWGADESLRYKSGREYWPPQYVPVQALTVHHTATDVGSDPAAHVRAIYYIQTIDKDWGDLGYNLLIDSSGRVYEGRSSGTDSWPIYGPQPGFDGRPLMNVGGHVKSFNAGNIGVCLLGNFHSSQPSAAAVSSLKKVLAGLSAVGQLKPLATVNYLDVNSGQAQTRSVISGHRNWAATECPGNAFYPSLAGIRTAVAGMVPPWEPPLQADVPTRHRDTTTPQAPPDSRR